MKAEYEDKHLKLDADGITINAYYFPLATKKFIPWQDMRSAQELFVSAATGKYRVWGMGLKPHWFHRDLRRFERSKAFVLDAGAFFKPVITPEQPGPVQAILRARGLLKKKP
ncbi:MAG: hypothetical protein EOP11_05130 [Proteobacteria bacterium]|nr:MAG: hypothetical protein EOP11_05130 [Pseudomonadota bacterium]